MKMKLLTCALLLAIAAGSSGYFLRGLREDSVPILTTQRIAKLEYFLSEKSFSEVENARAVLQALSDRFLMEARVKRLADYIESIQEK